MAKRKKIAMADVDRRRIFSRFNGTWESGPSDVVGAGVLAKIERAVREAYWQGILDGSERKMDAILDSLCDEPIVEGLCENKDQEIGYGYGFGAALLRVKERLRES